MVLPEDYASVGEYFSRLSANACDWLALARRLPRMPESLSEAIVSRPRDCDGAAAADALSARSEARLG